MNAADYLRAECPLGCDCPEVDGARQCGSDAVLDALEGVTLAELQWLGQLRAAFERKRAEKPTAWPAELAGALASPLLARLTLMELHHPTHQGTRKRPEVVRPDPPPAEVSSPVVKPGFVTVTKSEFPGGSPTPHPLDFKSLAAGERPDTDP